MNNLNDLLIQIDPTTGAYVPDAFGAGVDYVLITGAKENVDDIAITTSGIMYASSNLGNILGQDELITVNKTTGAATVLGSFNVSPLEGMTLSKNGTLYGSTGKEGSTPDNLWTINKATGATTLVGPYGSGHDYEGIACQLDLPTCMLTNTPTSTKTPGGPTDTPTNTPTNTATFTNKYIHIDQDAGRTNKYTNLYTHKYTHLYTDSDPHINTYAHAYQDRNQ